MDFSFECAINWALAKVLPAVDKFAISPNKQRWRVIFNVTKRFSPVSRLSHAFVWLKNLKQSF